MFKKKETIPEDSGTGEMTKLLKPTKVKRLRKGKIRITFIWILFLVGFIYAVYRNYTTVDTHTIVEREVVIAEIVDTSALISFVTNFAETYYAWDNTPTNLQKRFQQLELYMTEDLLRLNTGSISPGIHESAVVTNVQTWGIEKRDINTFNVWFTVNQRLEFAPPSTTNQREQLPESNQQESLHESNGQEPLLEYFPQERLIEYKNISSSFQIDVHVEIDGSMIVITNPTLHPFPMRSDFSPDTSSTNSNVTNEVIRDVEYFLESFFRLYPTLTEREMVHYVRDNALPVLQMERFEFDSFQRIVIQGSENEEQVRVMLIARFNDAMTNMTQLSQYDLLLEQNGSWSIIYDLSSRGNHAHENFKEE